MSNNIIEDEENWLYADVNTEHELKTEKVLNAWTSEEISQDQKLEVRQPTPNEDQISGFDFFQEDSDDDGIIVSFGNTDVQPTPNIKINCGLLAAKGENTQSQEQSLKVRQPTPNEDPMPEFENFEDDSDDGIIVSIGNTDVKPTFSYNTHNIKRNSGLLAAKGEKTQPVAQSQTFLVEDFTKPGNIDGTPVGEFNIDNIAEKPWRQPGADVSDYFNYNFNENTWTAYCERQKRIRLNESGSSHLQSNTSHCAIPVINGLGYNKKNGNPAINPVGPESHGSLVFPDMSKPPPMLNMGQFRPEHVLNSGLKLSQEKPPHTPPGPPISRSRSSTRSSSNTRSTKSVKEEKRNFRKNDSEERDLKKRRERSRERHHKRYERRERSRSRSRSRSRNYRDRHYGSNRSRRGHY